MGWARVGCVKAEAEHVQRPWFRKQHDEQVSGWSSESW